MGFGPMDTDLDKYNSNANRRVMVLKAIALWFKGERAATPWRTVLYIPISPRRRLLYIYVILT